MSVWMKWSDVAGSEESSGDVFLERTTTLAEYEVINALTIPRPSYY
jgi:hypothetical protein